MTHRPNMILYRDADGLALRPCTRRADEWLEIAFAFAHAECDDEAGLLTIARKAVEEGWRVEDRR